MCRDCGNGDVEYREELHRREGLVTFPYLFCTNCNKKTPINFAMVGSSKRFAVSVLANKCIGGTHPSLEMKHAMQDLPPPVSMPTYSNHTTAICKMSIL